MTKNPFFFFFFCGVGLGGGGVFFYKLTRIPYLIKNVLFFFLGGGGGVVKEGEGRCMCMNKCFKRHLLFKENTCAKLF